MISDKRRAYMVVKYIQCIYSFENIYTRYNLFSHLIHGYNLSNMPEVPSAHTGLLPVSITRTLPVPDGAIQEKDLPPFATLRTSVHSFVPK